MRKTRLLTIDDLAEYCQKYHFNHFSASDAGYSIAVQVPGEMVFNSTEDFDDLLRARVRVCHTLKNRNKSFISEENMKKAMPTLKNKPVLASIIETDSGELDFNGHDMRIVDGEDGESEIEYIERQVGSFTEDEPTLEYDAEYDKTYVIANAVVSREYTKAAEIIERKGGTKVSCEISVNDFQYNAKEKQLEILDFYFSGVTLLGEHIGEGMLGSRLDLNIEDFSVANNSAINNVDLTQTQFAEDKNITKGGSEMDKLTELFKRYNTTIDDLPFASEVESMTDEMLEERFAQLFADEGEDATADDTTETTETDDTSNEAAVVSADGAELSDEDEDDPEDDVVPDDDPEPTKRKTYTVSFGDKEYSYEISINDKCEALYRLVNDAYADIDDCWYHVIAYDKYVVMIDCWNDTAYRQSYSESEEGVFALIGDRERVYCQYLSQSELDALDSMKQSYAQMVAEEEKKSRDAVLNDISYSSIRNTDEWNELVKEASRFSAQDLAEKADALYGRFCKQQTNSGSIGISHNTSKSKKDAPYGNLFD